jgi:hypothetical protein
MIKRTVARCRTNEGQVVDIAIDRRPSICPICNSHIDPGLGEFYSNEKNMVAVFMCPQENCRKYFISNYLVGQGLGFIIYMYDSSFPVVIQKPNIHDHIKNLSPRFCSIYYQTEQARVHGLDEIYGIGLRKSLEFLIKDFAINEKPDDLKKIEGMHLSDCITNYISDDNIASCANMATWLGNDETHYLRKWQEHDVSDLRYLIELTLRWIESHIATQKYKSEIEQRRKK